MISIRSLTLSLILLGSQVALAQNALQDVPSFQPDKHIYTVPAGYTPISVTASDMANLETVASKLHSPFYVMLVNQINGGVHNLQSNNRLAVAASNQIQKAWASNPKFDGQKSSFFIFEDGGPKGGRILHFMPAPQWQADLGMFFGSTKPDPYMPKFKNKAAPKPPQRPNFAAGIVDLMQSFDNDVWQQIDPVQIAKRAQANTAILVQKLNGASESLKGLLEQTEYLPSDVAPYKHLLMDAEAAVSSSKDDAIRASTTAITEATSQLSALVEAKHHEATAKVVNKTLWRCGWFLLWFGIGWGLITFRKRFTVLRATFENEASLWQEKITKALGQYERFQQNRDQIIGLQKVTGKTKICYEEVTGQVRDIYTSIKAIESHLSLCRLQAGKATVFNLAPLKEALESLEKGEIEFDTGVLNKDDLFGGDTKTIKVRPDKFAAEQAAKFKEASKGWDKLQKAAEERLVVTAHVFDQDLKDLAVYQEKCTKTGIPAHWYSDHPLLNATALYARIDAIRASDPLAVVEEIAIQTKAIRKVTDRLDILQGALKDLTKIPQEIPSYGETVFSTPESDPATMFNSAKKVAGSMASLLVATDLSTKPIVEAAKKACALYAEAVQKVSDLSKLIQDSPGLVERGTLAGQGIPNQIREATLRLEAASKIHPATKLQTAQSSVEQAGHSLTQGNASIKEAQKALIEKRHVDAKESAERARSAFLKAKTLCGTAIQDCDTLDQHKRDFEMQQAQMKKLQQKKAQEFERVRKYARVQSLPQTIIVNNTNTQSHFDYESGLASMMAQQAAWNLEIEYAQRQQRDEERRLENQRQEMERQSRREREEENRRSYRQERDNDDSDGGSTTSFSSQDRDDDSDGGSTSMISSDNDNTPDGGDTDTI